MLTALDHAGKRAIPPWALSGLPLVSCSAPDEAPVIAEPPVRRRLRLRRRLRHAARAQGRPIRLRAPPKLLLPLLLLPPWPLQPLAGSDCISGRGRCTRQTPTGKAARGCGCPASPLPAGRHTSGHRPPATAPRLPPRPSGSTGSAPAGDEAGGS